MGAAFRYRMCWQLLVTSPISRRRRCCERYLAGVSASERLAALDAVARAELLAAMGELLARIHALPLAEVYAFWQFPEDTVHAPADWATNFVQKKVASDLAVLSSERRAGG